MWCSRADSLDRYYLALEFSIIGYADFRLAAAPSIQSKYETLGSSG